MSTFEKIVFGLLASAEVVLPTVIKSEQGTALLNVSEEGLLAFLSAMQKPKSTTT